MRIIEKQALKKLFNELKKIRKTKHFLEYGLGKGGKNHIWLIRLKEIKQDKNASVNGIIAAKDLHMLAIQYIATKGYSDIHSKELTISIRDSLK